MACPDRMESLDFSDLTTPELRKCYEAYLERPLTPEELAQTIDSANRKGGGKTAVDPNVPWWSSVLAVAKTGMDVYAQRQLIEAAKRARKTGQKVLVDTPIVEQAKVRSGLDKRVVYGGLAVLALALGVWAFWPRKK